jgi:Xaa-Pro aminopeptidase
MVWTAQQLGWHLDATKRLEKARANALEFFRRRLRDGRFLTERDLADFIRVQYQKLGIRPQHGIHNPIVACNENSASPHYYAPARGSKVIGKDCVLKLDMWGKLQNRYGPFSDLTWMVYTGRRVPGDVHKVCDTVFTSRDTGVLAVRSALAAGVLPYGKDIDAACRNVIARAGYGRYFTHGTGHDLSARFDHGTGPDLRRKETRRLRKGQGFTIEPGIYLPGRFGGRSEICCHIDPALKLRITCQVQDEIQRVY